MSERTCRRCGITKDLSEFSKDRKGKDGISSRCKECAAANTRSWSAANRERKSEAARKWREQNRERILARGAEYRRANREVLEEKQKAWRAKNGHVVVARVKKWREENKEHVNAKRRAETARRRARLKLACPRWADHKFIDWIYELAGKYSEMTGIPHDVDHIIPIAGKRACGLHVPENLRIIPASENRKKHTKEVEGFGAARVEWF